MVDVCEAEGCFVPTIHNLVFFGGVFVIANSVWIVLPLLEIKKSYDFILQADDWHYKGSTKFEEHFHESLTSSTTYTPTRGNDSVINKDSKKKTRAK